MSYIMAKVSLQLCPHLLAFQAGLSVLLHKSASHWQDEEDQAYLMDEAGNIEPSQTANAAHLGEDSVGAWGDSQDDLKYAEILGDFEQNSGEIPDHLRPASILEFDM